MPVLTLIFTTGVVVTVIALGFNLALTHMKMRHENQNNLGSEGMRNLERRLAAIEDRLANVETIATSREFQLERKFAELDETPVVFAESRR